MPTYVSHNCGLATRICEDWCTWC